MLASTGPMFTRPLDWALGVIAEAGYDGAELMVTQDPDTQDADRVRALSAQEGCVTPAVHGPFLLVTRRVFSTDLVLKARRSLELASALEADVMVVHPPFRWQGAFHRWLLEDGDEEAARLGTRVGVENLYPVGIASRRVRLHKYTAPEHLTPFRHVVMDTSHFAVGDEDIHRAWDVLRHNTAHLHISDNRGMGRDSHAPLGHGILPMASFLARVGRDTSMNTSITMELDCRRYLDDRAALVGYLRQERFKCLALMAGESSEEVLGRPDHVDTPMGGGDDAHQPTAAPGF
jgi:sugar phosphate isomerase/epimerase